MTQWSHELVARVAAELRQTRKDAKMSAARLSDLTAELGMRVSRSVIADLETGRKRSLDVSELIVLAAALDVPPLQLVYPDLPDGVVRVWPGSDVRPPFDVRSIYAAQWFSGEYGHGVGDDDGVDYLLSDPDSRINAARKVEHAADERWRAEIKVRVSASEQGNIEALETAQTLLRLATEKLIRVAAEAILAGANVDVQRFPDEVQKSIHEQLSGKPDASRSGSDGR